MENSTCRNMAYSDPVYIARRARHLEGLLEAVFITTPAAIDDEHPKCHQTDWLEKFMTKK